MRQPCPSDAPSNLDRMPLFLGVPETWLYLELGVVLVAGLFLGFRPWAWLGVLLALGALSHGPVMALAKRDPRLPGRWLRRAFAWRHRFKPFSSEGSGRFASLAFVLLTTTGCSSTSFHWSGLLAAGVVSYLFGVYQVARDQRKLALAEGFAGVLPWKMMLEKNFVFTEDEAVMAAWRIRGPDLHSSTDEELEVVAGRIRSFLETFDASWTIQLEQAIRPVDPVEAPELPETPVQPVLEARNRQFADGSKARMETHLFLTFEPQAPHQERLEKAAEFLKSLPEILPELRPERLSGDELVDYLAFTLGKRSQAPPEDADLGELLAEPVESTRKGMVIGEDLHVATLEITGYPEKLYFGLLDLLPRLVTPCRLTSVMTPLRSTDVRRRLKANRYRWSRRRLSLTALTMREALKTEPVLDEDGEDLESSKFARRMMLQIAEATHRLESGEERYFDYGQILTFYGTEREVGEAVQAVRSELERRAIAFLRDKKATLDTFLAFLPGRRERVLGHKLQPLSLSIRTLPILEPWPGAREIDYAPLDGPALLQARISGTSQTFGFTPYCEGVGHQLVLGPTGSGKSALLSAEALAFYGSYPSTRVVFFDYGRSSVEPARFAGGAVYDLTRDALSLQPLAAVDTPQGLQSGADFLERAFALNHSERPTPRDREDLRSALAALANEPPERRTLTNFVHLVQSPTIQLALGDLLASGPLGALLDGSPKDRTFARDARYLVIETERIFELDDRLALPTLHALLQRVTRLLHEEKPSLLVIDECWVLLRHPLFKDLIPLWLATLRKKNAAVILATQSIAQLDDPALLSMITQQCPTKIFLPDRSALKHPEPYERIGLSSQQIHRLAHAQPRREYYITRPEGNALVDFELRPPLSDVLFSTHHVR